VIAQQLGRDGGFFSDRLLALNWGHGNSGVEALFSHDKRGCESELQFVGVRHGSEYLCRFLFGLEFLAY
jgi:hypothetical protein